MVLSKKKNNNQVPARRRKQQPDWDCTRTDLGRFKLNKDEELLKLKIKQEDLSRRFNFYTKYASGEDLRDADSRNRYSSDEDSVEGSNDDEEKRHATSDADRVASETEILSPGQTRHKPQTPRQRRNVARKRDSEERADDIAKLERKHGLHLHGLSPRVTSHESKPWLPAGRSSSTSKKKQKQNRLGQSQQQRRPEPEDYELESINIERLETARRDLESNIAKSLWGLQSSLPRSLDDEVSANVPSKTIGGYIEVVMDGLAKLSAQVRQGGQRVETEVAARASLSDTINEQARRIVKLEQELQQARLEAKNALVEVRMDTERQLSSLRTDIAMLMQQQRTENGVALAQSHSGWMALSHTTTISTGDDPSVTKAPSLPQPYTQSPRGSIPLKTSLRDEAKSTSPQPYAQAKAVISNKATPVHENRKELEGTASLVDSRRAGVGRHDVSAWLDALEQRRFPPLDAPFDESPMRREDSGLPKPSSPTANTGVKVFHAWEKITENGSPLPNRERKPFNPVVNINKHFNQSWTRPIENAPLEQQTWDDIQPQSTPSPRSSSSSLIVHPDTVSIDPRPPLQARPRAVSRATVIVTTTKNRAAD